MSEEIMVKKVGRGERVESIKDTEPMIMRLAKAHAGLKYREPETDKDVIQFQLMFVEGEGGAGGFLLKAPTLEKLLSSRHACFTELAGGNGEAAVILDEIDKLISIDNFTPERPTLRIEKMNVVTGRIAAYWEIDTRFIDKTLTVFIALTEGIAVMDAVIEDSMALTQTIH